MSNKLYEYAESLAVPLPAEMPSFEEYDEFHINTSGGKDSWAMMVLLLYGYKLPKEKIKLLHFRVDGHESNPAFFDYEETDPYIKEIAKKFELELIFLHSEKGLKQRIMERGMWPGPNSQYCTSSLKRDVYSKWARRRGEGRYLCLSGERAAESSRRAKNLAKENFKSYKSATAVTKKRIVDWYRPIFHLDSDQVWRLMELAGIEPHPCYTKYQVSRCSCKFCIFLSPKEMLSVSKHCPDEFAKLVEMENQMGHMMKFEKGKPISLLDFVKKAETDYEQEELFPLPCGRF